MSSWKETLDREYRDTGAPERIGKWVLLGIAGYLVYKLLEPLSKATLSIGTGVQQVSKIFASTPSGLLATFRAEYPKVLARGIQPTISTTQMAIEGDNMEQAFRTGPFGWRENSKAILEIFGKLRNDADFMNLFFAFGTRDWGVGTNEGNLLEWLNEWEFDLKPEINALLERNAGSELRV